MRSSKLIDNQIKHCFTDERMYKAFEDAFMISACMQSIYTYKEKEGRKSGYQGIAGLASNIFIDLFVNDKDNMPRIDVFRETKASYLTDAQVYAPTIDMPYATLLHRSSALSGESLDKRLAIVNIGGIPDRTITKIAENIKYAADLYNGQI